jgi:hypothetical protein
VDDFFDPSLLAELETLVVDPAAASAGGTLPFQGLDRELDTFLAAPPGAEVAETLTEAAFVALSPAEMADRTNRLIEICRQSPRPSAVHAVEAFIVFFQALLPTLEPEGARAIRAVFFRLVPTLLHIAWNDFGEREDQRADGHKAVQQLENILFEISSVRLAPSEGQLVFRSIDQMTAFISAGDYALATDVVSSRLLSIIARNKLTRALFRLMEVEVAIQCYLKEKRGYTTPQIHVPDDFVNLSEYGPVRILREDGLDGQVHHLLQVHLPDMPILRDVVLRMVASDGVTHDLRLDALGSAELRLAPGAYAMGLVYEPEAGSAVRPSRSPEGPGPQAH